MTLRLLASIPALIVGAALATFASPTVAAAPAAAPAIEKTSTRGIAVPAPRGGREPGARLYASWNAPYGTPGAAAAIDAACGDTSRVDTLYLSFDPGSDAPDFRGLTAVFYFHPAEDAALAVYWQRGGGGVNGSPLQVIYSSDPERGFETIWTSMAAGGQAYDFVQTSGRLRMIYANPSKVSDGVLAGRIYGLARILVRRPAAGSDGCGVPMCVEWFNARLAYGMGDERDVNKGERHVTLNSPDGGVCGPQLESAGIKPWTPGKR